MNIQANHDAAPQGRRPAHYTKRATLAAATLSLLLLSAAFVFAAEPQTNDDNPVFENPIQKAKMDMAGEGSVHCFTWAQKYGANVGWGTDMFGRREAFDCTNLEFKSRAEYYSAAEQLKQVTSDNATLLALSGAKNPYKEAKLGVIEPAAYADLLIVDGDPTKDIMLMLDYENNFKLIMKDGVAYKNTL